MAKPLTIRELHGILTFEILQGRGDKFALMSDDDECNGFHPVWNGTTNMDDWDVNTLGICHLHGLKAEFVKEKCAIIC